MYFDYFVSMNCNTHFPLYFVFVDSRYSSVNKIKIYKRLLISRPPPKPYGIMSTVKVDRTKKKRAITKKINLVKHMVAEDEIGKAKEEIANLKLVFKEFQEMHE